MTTTAKNYKEALDEMIDAETAANILNEETQTRTVSHLQQFLDDMGICEDYHKIESDAIEIAQKMFDDINNRKNKCAQTKKLDKKTRNNRIIEAIENLLLVATGEQNGIAETWKNCGHDSVTLQEVIDDIKAWQDNIPQENKPLFAAAHIAADALDEYE